MLEYKPAPFTFRKDGIFYFARRVPSDLLHHYSSVKISYSLRTRSSSVAAARATQAACKLDEYWFHLRSQEAQLPGKHLLRTGLARPQDRAETDAVTSDALTLSEAVVTYLRLKGQGKCKTFHRAAERSCGYVIDACGDKPLADYSKKDANAFRDVMVDRGLAGSSITRVFGTVRSVFNFAVGEEGLSIKNPFTNVYYDRDARVSGRLTISEYDLRKVQKRCFDTDDELRWLVALVSDTGMRLAEAAGLLRGDFEQHADGLILVHIRPHPWRRLKTKGSERSLPLFGAAAWAARRLLAEQVSEGFAFPRYNKGEFTNANSASAALNKWLKPMVADGVSMHSFRHAMRDRLRAVECPADVVDQIGGWQTEGVGHGYGVGYPMPVLARWLAAVVHP